MMVLFGIGTMTRAKTIAYQPYLSHHYWPHEKSPSLMLKTNRLSPLAPTIPFLAILFYPHVWSSWRACGTSIAMASSPWTFLSSNGHWRPPRWQGNKEPVCCRRRNPRWIELLQSHLQLPRHHGYRYPLPRRHGWRHHLDAMAVSPFASFVCPFFLAVNEMAPMALLQPVFI